MMCKIYLWQNDVDDGAIDQHPGSLFVNSHLVVQIAVNDRIATTNSDLQVRSGHFDVNIVRFEGNAGAKRDADLNKLNIDAN